jgi:hypothetical protein
VRHEVARLIDRESTATANVADEFLVAHFGSCRPIRGLSCAIQGRAQA